MVAKKDLLKDLKKYNKDLEKHLGSVDNDMLVEKAALAGKSDQEEDFFTLLSSQFMDLRTEVNLLRKNLTNDVEKMALQLINENQQHVSSLLKSIESRIFLENKKMLNNHFEMVSSEMHSLKEEVGAVMHKVSSVSNEVDEIRDTLQQNFAELDHNNSQLEHKFTSLEDAAHKAFLTKKELEDVQDRQKKLTNTLSTAHKHFEKNLLSVNRQVGGFEKEMKTLLSQKSMPTNAQRDDQRDKNISVERPQKVVQDVIRDLDTSQEEPRERNEEFSQKVQKVVDLDERLSRLHSLK